MGDFEVREISSGLLFDRSCDPFPTRVIGFAENEDVSFECRGSVFGFVSSGEVELSYEVEGRRLTVPLAANMYFAVNREVRMRSRGRGILIANDHHHGFQSVGGPIEAKGRLKYIDGCTDSLLICPTLLGDPCLNLLDFPPNILQTPHTHPSFRAGVIARGSGYCVLPDRKVRLLPGMAWIIGTGVKHCFHSDPGGLAVIAYHPDSDWGPTHEVHPMINRTIIAAQ